MVLCLLICQTGRQGSYPGKRAQGKRRGALSPRKANAVAMAHLKRPSLFLGVFLGVPCHTGEIKAADPLVAQNL